jgi:HPt (histidine-containing phosphotransfer) domain-containing protein
MLEARIGKRRGAQGRRSDPNPCGRLALSVANDADALSQGCAAAFDGFPACVDEAAGSSAPVETPVFDVRAMLRNLDDDVELVRELAGCFVASALELMAGMRRSLAEGDATALGCGAHAMKGAAGNFHAAPAVAAAAALETSARQGDLARAAPELAALEREIVRLLPLLETLHGATPVADDR